MAIPKTPDDWAAAVADGEEIDWAALAGGAATPQERRQIEQFAMLARIAGVHADAWCDDSPVDPAGLAAEYEPGDTWGSLRVVERLAAGTFGTVYRAHDPALARDVALKILRLPASTPALADEALKEGRLLARVRHPNVVAVYGADQHDGLIGMWMELVEGRTLEEELDVRGPLPEHEVTAIGQDLARALEAVHGASLVHRDVKAQNVMRDARDGRIVLMDLSAGAEPREDASLRDSWPATLTGSPLYLAPELLEGAPASFHSDVYSLGVLLFRLLTATYPVSGTTLNDVVRAHRTATVTPLRTARPGVTSILSALVGRATEADPRRRPTVRELVEALGRLRRSSPDRPWRAPPALAATCVATIFALGYLAAVRPDAVPLVRAVARPPALTVTSASGAAVRLYEEAAADVLAVHGWRADDARPRLERADALLVRALALDPRFATALSLRARVRELRDDPRPEDRYVRHGDHGGPRAPGSAVDLAEQALAHAGGVPTGERAAIEGYANRLRADEAPGRRDHLVAASNAYEEVLSEAPADYWALTELSRIYVRLQQRGDAERVITQGAGHHPHAPRLADAAAVVYLRHRDRPALRRVATEALAKARPEHHRSPSQASDALASLVLWEAKDAWMDGDPAKVLGVLRRASQVHRVSPNQRIAFELASAFESLGRFDDGRVSARQLSLARSREFKLALLDARQERWTHLRARLTPRASRPEQLELFSFMYIWAGWLHDAERLLALYTSGAVPAPWRVRQEFEATLRTAQGRSPEALALFAPLLVDEWNPQLRMRETLGRARVQAGDVHGARTLLERVYREPIMAMQRGMGAYDWLRCVVLLAEIHRDAGRRDDAARVADTARRYLAVADAEHPFVARLARLP